MFGSLKTKKSIDVNNNKLMKKVCANCRQNYREGDKYCRFCGAPMGKPDFIEDNMQVIYGSPSIESKHKCKKCGYQWTTSYMGYDNEKWCPQCGGSAPIYEDGVRLSLMYEKRGGWGTYVIHLAGDKDAIIGRSPNCDVVINNIYISRQQFRISMNDTTELNVFIENLGKTNPAYINEKPFDGLIRLKSGDRISVGTLSFLVYFHYE